MTKPALPDSQRRVPISVSLDPAVLQLLDTIVACGEANTRSRAVELAISEWQRTRSVRKARR